MHVQPKISDTIEVSASSSLVSSFVVPGDKSITHRAIILASISNVTVLVKNYLASEDCLNTIRAMQGLGVKIIFIKDSLLIHGVGLYGLQKPKHDLYLGNSGTALRLLSGILSAQNFSTVLYGDNSLNGRPMQRIIEPLTLMGSKISAINNNYAPLTIKPAILKPIKYTLPIASAQVKSAILFAGLYTNNQTIVLDNFDTRDHSERMLKYLLPHLSDNILYHKEVRFKSTNINKKNIDMLNSEFNLSIDVPGDISSAAFFIVAALITKNSNLTIKNVGVNYTRTGVIDILCAMGANIDFVNRYEINNEPRADIKVSSSSLIGVDINKSIVPRAIDEFPIIFVAAAVAKNTTIILGLDELKHKESDRLNCMIKNLKILGVDIEKYQDGVRIHGGATITGGAVDSFGDHRIAMSLAIAALVAREPVIIKNCSNIVTSFPNFVTILQNCGGHIRYLSKALS